MTDNICRQSPPLDLVVQPHLKPSAGSKSRSKSTNKRVSRFDTSIFFLQLCFYIPHTVLDMLFQAFQGFGKIASLTSYLIKRL